MALTGLLLGCFLLFHAFGNSFIFQGPEAFNRYADKLHLLGPLLPAVGLLLLTILLLHVLTGISLAMRNRKAKGQHCAIRKSAGRRTIASRTMLLTGTASFAFILMHLSTIRFADQIMPVAERVSRVLADPLYALLYAAGIAALGLHLSHGFWSLTQSIGLDHARCNALIRAGCWLLCALIVGVFAGIIAWSTPLNVVLRVVLKT